MRKHANQAKFFIGFIKERWDTIRQITECIVDVQRDFLDHGIRQLKPLTRSEVAYRVGLHESTVSRATANKYMLLPTKRVISFDDVFDGSLAIKDAIREIIGQRGPRASAQRRGDRRPSCASKACSWRAAPWPNTARRSTSCPPHSAAAPTRTPPAPAWLPRRAPPPG